MNLHRATADLFIPDDSSPEEALRRITHLGIGAHQDDLEFMAFHGILECFGTESRWFGGVTCSDGAGSSRAGEFADFDDQEMRRVRRIEQRSAASAGNYGAMIQLDYPGSMIRNPSDSALVNDLREILMATQPGVVYTHNPADKHGTHLAVAVASLRAMRTLPPKDRPARVIGCEVWRDLDWLPDTEKVIMNVSGGDHLPGTLNACFQSQIAGGKRYDLATMGRRAANATFLDPQRRDGAQQVIFGMDLTPLVHDETLDITEFVCGFVERFHAEVRNGLLRHSGGRQEFPSSSSGRNP